MHRWRAITRAFRMCTAARMRPPYEHASANPNQKQRKLIPQGASQSLRQPATRKHAPQGLFTSISPGRASIDKYRPVPYCPRSSSCWNTTPPMKTTKKRMRAEMAMLLNTSRLVGRVTCLPIRESRRFSDCARVMCAQQDVNMTVCTSLSRVCTCVHVMLTHR